MKKILFSTIVMLFVVSIVSAQDVFKKDDVVFNIGIGLNNSLYYGSKYSNAILPISFSGEIGIKDNLINGDNGSIGVGGYLGYTGAKWNDILGYGYKYTSIIIGTRGAFHYEFAPKLDTYAGAMLGYDVRSSKWFGGGTSSGIASGSDFTFSLFLGARYWFNPNFGVYTELGYGISNINIGLTFKL